MLISVFTASVMGVIVKSLSEGFPIVELVFGRSLFAALFLAGLVPLNGGLSSVRIYNLRSHVIRCLYGVLATSLYFLSVQTLPFGMATVLGMCAPFMTAGCSSIVVRESVPLSVWLAAAVGFLGVLTCLVPIEISMDYGVATGFFGALFLSLSRLEVRKLARTETSFAMTFHFSTTVALISGLATVLVFKMPSMPDAFLIICLGVCGALAQVIQAHAHKFAPAAFLAPLDYTSLVWGFFFGFFIWNESIGGKQIIGAVIIFSAGLILNFSTLSSKKSWARFRAAWL